MKAHVLFVTLGLSLLSISAFARPGVTCGARDVKWEEHWSGHGDCDSCIKEHGSCIESCNLSYYTCEARGTDYQRQSIILKGRGVDRYEAERNALKYCQKSFYDCSVVTCTTESEEVSRRQCPQPPPAPAPVQPALGPAPVQPGPITPAPVKPGPTPTPSPTPIRQVPGAIYK